MTPARADEEIRLEALHRYSILDTGREQDFDDLVKIAAQVCGAPIAVLNFVDRDRQWGKALVGLDDSEAPREDSFCARTIEHDGDVMVVADAREDPRFAANPMVLGDENVRFYAGAPLISREGAALGAMCVVDRVPRELDDTQLSALLALARQAMNQLELRLMLEREQEQVRRLEELDQLKDRFVAVVSHELRTPLTSVKGYLDAVLEEPESLTPDHLRFLGIASRNADRLQGLVEDLLDLMRAEEGRFQVRTEPGDLARLVREAAASIAPLAERSGVSLRTELPDELTVQVDAMRIGQVLDNLFSNAVKYTPGGGEVDVQLMEDGGSALLRVADTGIGVPERDRERLFESFFRASSAVEHGIPGTGLGLAVARRIVRAHGGSLALGEARPCGSEFVLTLPLAVPAIQPG